MKPVWDKLYRVWVWIRATFGAFAAIFWPKAWPYLAKALTSAVMSLLVGIHLRVDPTYVAGSGELLWLPLDTWNQVIQMSVNALGAYISVWLIPNKVASLADKQDAVVRTVVEIPPK